MHEQGLDIGRTGLGQVVMTQPITVYEVVQEPSTQTTISDVLIGAAAVVVGLTVIATILGLVCAGFLIVVRRMRSQDGGAAGDTDATRLGLNTSSPSPGNASPKS